MYCIFFISVLGMNRSSFSKEELGHVFRRLAAKHHPDRVTGTVDFQL
jgi:DnaJ-class molecular chaperone